MRRDRPAAFKGRHFEPEIIILCVRRYLRFALSLRNLEEIMTERNVHVDHVTISAGSWIMLRNSVGVVDANCGTRTDRGGWMKPTFALLANGPIYRAVDSTGDTIDFLLSSKRDAAAAKRFFQRALRSPNHPPPRVINVDRNPAYPKAIAELKGTRDLGRGCRCRPVRYLNNISVGGPELGRYVHPGASEASPSFQHVAP
jgi:transposase, IS6 family